MDTAQLFRDRLLRDLRDIQANADSGFYVHVASHDMRRLCVHICPEFGPLAKLRLHFTVELPSNWVSEKFCHTSFWRHVLPA